MEGEAAQAFEERLAHDQAAREALREAVQLTQTLIGGEALAPRVTYRDQVRRRLQSIPPHESQSGARCNSPPAMVN
jgi:hypothetical protein